MNLAAFIRLQGFGNRYFGVGGARAQTGGPGRRRRRRPQYMDDVMAVLMSITPELFAQFTDRVEIDEPEN